MNRTYYVPKNRIITSLCLFVCLFVFVFLFFCLFIYLFLPVFNMCEITSFG